MWSTPQKNQYRSQPRFQRDTRFLKPQPQFQQYANTKPQPQFQQYVNTKPRPQFQPTKNFFSRPEPMEIDESNRTKQSNWRQYPQKREFNSSRQHYEQPQKIQRINQLTDGTPTSKSTPDDLISNISGCSTETNLSSAFLEE